MRPADEGSGAVGPADHDVDVLRGRRREESLQSAFVVEQRVAAGQQEGVRARLIDIQGQLQRLDPVDAQTPTLDDALVS